MRTFFLATFASINLLSCAALPPYYTTEKAMIAIFNDTNRALQYRAQLSGSWSKKMEIDAKQASLLNTYEQESRTEPLPVWLSNIEIFSNACVIEFDRKLLEQKMIRDPEGPQGWQRRIDDVLLDKHSC